MASQAAWRGVAGTGGSRFEMQGAARTADRRTVASIPGHECRRGPTNTTGFLATHVLGMGAGRAGAGWLPLYCAALAPWIWPTPSQAEALRRLPPSARRPPPNSNGGVDPPNGRATGGDRDRPRRGSRGLRGGLLLARRPGGPGGPALSHNKRVPRPRSAVARWCEPLGPLAPPPSPPPPISASSSSLQGRSLAVAVCWSAGRGPSRLSHRLIVTLGRGETGPDTFPGVAA